MAYIPERDKERNRAYSAAKRWDYKVRSGRNQTPTNREADWKRQGIDLKYSEYMEMLIACEYKCQICTVEVGESGYVDHNHDTGEIRGILCKDCNLMIQFAAEQPVILLRAAGYLIQ